MDAHEVAADGSAPALPAAATSRPSARRLGRPPPPGRPRRHRPRSTGTASPRPGRGAGLAALAGGGVTGTGATGKGATGAATGRAGRVSPMRGRSAGRLRSAPGGGAELRRGERPRRRRRARCRRRRPACRGPRRPSPCGPRRPAHRHRRPASRRRRDRRRHPAPWRPPGAPRWGARLRRRRGPFEDVVRAARRRECRRDAVSPASPAVVSPEAGSSVGPFASGVLRGCSIDPVGGVRGPGVGGDAGADGEPVGSAVGCPALVSDMGTIPSRTSHEARSQMTAVPAGSAMRGSQREPSRSIH